jgi:hypothetical protein
MSKLQFALKTTPLEPWRGTRWSLHPSQGAAGVTSALDLYPQIQLHTPPSGGGRMMGGQPRYPCGPPAAPPCLFTGSCHDFELRQGKIWYKTAIPVVGFPWGRGNFVLASHVQ